MRLFHLVARLWPPALRRSYGDAMSEAFGRRLADARARGRAGTARFLVRELVSLIRIALVERCRPMADGQVRQRSTAGGKAGHVDAIAQELRHAARRLMHSPAFTIAALATLALAIGANAAIFTVVERVVLNPLPYPASERIIKLAHHVPRIGGQPFESLPPGLYLEYADRARSLAATAAYQTAEMTVTGSGLPERIGVARVTRSLQDVLLVQPAIGRWFTPEEAAPGGPPVAVIAHNLWERRFARNPGVLGQVLNLNGVALEIVGVMPPAFAFPSLRIDAWIPEPVTRAAGFGLMTHTAVARLADGATVDSARADMDALIADLPRTYAESTLAVSLALDKDRMRSLAITLKEWTVGQVERALWILLGAVGVVLLVACANVANLFLARSDVRRREVAVRQALGAGRAGIVRFFLAESMLLSLAGGALGLALAWAALQLVVGAAPATLPRVAEVRLTTASLLFTLGLALVTALAFGVIPLVQRAPLTATLHENGRGSSPAPRRHRIRQLLMASQTALALVLLVASGLFIRSFQQLRAIDPGFDASSAITFRIGLPARQYPDREAAVAVHRAILERLADLPNVAAASASTCLPLDGRCYGNSIFVDDGRDRTRPPTTNQARPTVMFRGVAAGYFEVIGMRMQRGRALSPDDVDFGRPNVVVNRRFADAYFPNQDPIGQRIASSRPPTLPPPAWLTIVGGVPTTPTTALAEAQTDPQVYMPMSVAGGPNIPAGLLVGPDISTINYVVRTAGPTPGLLPAIRRAVDRVDANLAIADPRLLATILERASAQMAFTMTLLAIAGAMTLVLGIVGIYGVTSYIVGQRTGEIGVRLALGADPRSVSTMIVTQGGRVVAAGVGAGLVAAGAGSRIVESVLYSVSPLDPAVFGLTALMLLGVGLLACWIPARRAARLSPVEALRSE